MIKDVHRPHRGRGSKFQNHKVTSYKIRTTGVLDRSFLDEARNLINPDFTRHPADPYRLGFQEWKFYSKQAADRAWMLLLLKYGD